VPAGYSKEMLQNLGEDVSDIIVAVDYYLVCGEGGRQPLLQRTLTYSSIPPEVMESWRRPQVRDVSGDQADGSSQESFRTGVSVFYFEEVPFTVVPCPVPRERRHHEFQYPA
jgi:hypothetical protein